MKALVRCPDCAKTFVESLSTLNVGSTPLLLLNEQAVHDSTDVECPFCKKELHVILSMELFE